MNVTEILIKYLTLAEVYTNILIHHTLIEQSSSHSWQLTVLPLRTERHRRSFDPTAV